MSDYSNGRAREYKVRDDMVAHGWHFVCRASSSKGAADLVMVHEIHGLALVQVGSRTKTLGPYSRRLLCDLAEMGGALALLAIVVPRRPIAYWQVDRGMPKGWDRWEVDGERCGCPPCPGRGNDGHGLTHCAECCFGSGVEADPACPIHGVVALGGSL